MKRKSENNSKVFQQDSDELLESVMKRISTNQSKNMGTDRIPSFDGVVKHIVARQEERASQMKKSLFPLKLVDSIFKLFLIFSGIFFLWKFIFPLFNSVFNNPEIATAQGLDPNVLLMIGIMTGLFAAVTVLVFFVSILKPVKS